MTSAIQKHHEDRERAYHEILVRTGLRPQGSRVEDYRPKPVQIEPEAVPLEKITARMGDQDDG